MALSRLNMIAAVSRNNGIGFNNELPWRIREDTQFFNRITTEAAGNQKNVVIMGRKTWESIPEKLRPLSRRINMVVSSSIPTAREDIFVVKTFDESLSVASELKKDGKVNEVFVIGGSKMYKAAMNQSHYPVRFYCTHVMKDFECDTFFPEIDWNNYKEIRLLTVDSEVKHSGDLEFRFAVYERITAA